MAKITKIEFFADHCSDGIWVTDDEDRFGVNYNAAYLMYDYGIRISKSLNDKIDLMNTLWEWLVTCDSEESTLFDMSVFDIMSLKIAEQFKKEHPEYKDVVVHRKFYSK